MNLAKSSEFFSPGMISGEKIQIIGCGAIGSTVAENLARFGISDIVLYDFDVVESHNIANQLFTSEDIGKCKVDALAEKLVAINPEINVELQKDGWNGQVLSGYVFLAVDNIEIRKEIAEENKRNKMVRGMFDFRMGLTDAQHYAANWGDRKMVEKFISTMNFSHEEAQANEPVSACNMALSVCPTVRMIVACGVSNFVNFVRNNALKSIILIDAFKFDVDAL